VSASGYSFAARQGLSLSNAFVDFTNYSILLDFSFTDLTGYRKIVDFLNLASDNGLYNLAQSLDFFPVANSGTADFAVNQPVRVILTRASSGNTVTGYVNGVSKISFTDSSSFAVFSAANNIAYFFEDDNVTSGNESSGGTATRVQIYNGVLTSAEAAALGGPPITSVGTPEPATLVLFGAGLVSLALFRRWTA